MSRSQYDPAAYRGKAKTVRTPLVPPAHVLIQQAYARTGSVKQTMDDLGLTYEQVYKAIHQDWL